jgi:PAS domain S-box-containing protein
MTYTVKGIKKVSKKHPFLIKLFFKLKSEIDFLDSQIFKRAINVHIAILLILLSILDTTALAKTTNQALLNDNKDFKPKILVLHSYHYGFTWSDKISKGIQSVFAEDSGKVELLFEFMDTRRIYDENYFKQLKEFYRVKYANRPIDVIICCDDHALNFVLGLGHDLFAEIPIVFCSVSGYKPSMREGRSLTGLLESVDIKSTLDVALRLHPRTKEVAVITDMTRTGKALKINAEKIFKNYEQRVKFRYINDLTIDQLKDQVSSFSQDTIVFLFIFSKDKAGRVFSHEHNLRILKKHCNVPIYSVWEFYLGNGILGGMLTSGELEGKMAGEMAMRILNGEKASNIPLILSPTQYMFDYEQLKRFGVKESILPKDSKVMKKPFSFFSKYKDLAFSVAFVIALLLLAVFTLAGNIAKRKQAEEALKKSEKNYRELVQNANSIILRFNTEGEITFINDYAQRFLGFEQNEIIGKHVVGTIVPEKDSAGEALGLMFQNLIKDPDRYRNNENENIRKNGERIWVAWANKAIRDESGKIVEILSIGNDITEQKQATKALQESEEKYRNILENIEEGYFELDIKGKLTFFNNSLCRITGYDEKELMGLSYKQYSNPETADKMFHVFNQIFRSGKPAGIIDFDINLKDGRNLTIDLSATPIKSTDGQIIGFRGIMRDVSERKKAEKERQMLEKKLQQAQKMKAVGTLAGGVAHDLNNILSGIVSYPELVLMELPETSRLREPIKTIQDSGKKAAAIVQDLLTLARRGVSISEVVNVNNIISEYLVSPEFDKLNSFHPLVEVQTHLDSALLNVMGSPVHLSKTVMNLVSNAAEAMPEGGKIRISTENLYIDRPVSGYDSIEEGDYVVLIVSDTGIGIADDEIERVFEPFYTKKIMGRSGTGLGMAVVWGTVKDHKGYINVESTLGKGTTFKLYFPVTRNQKVEDQNSKKLIDYKGNGESILVVDDVKEQREIASKILSQLGYSVKIVSSGEEAIKLLEKEKVDLIVLDMIMPPGIDGFETYKRIVNKHPKQKAIIASGFTETERVKKVQQLGAGEYVKKPYTIETIGMAVKTELEYEKKAA